MGKTILALLPAILAHASLFVMAELKVGQEWWGLVLLGLLLLGGILSAVFVTRSIRKSNVERSPFLIGLIGFVIVVLYVATFFFTGCLTAITQGL